MSPARAEQAARLTLAILGLERLLTTLKKAEAKAVRRRVRAALASAKSAYRAKHRLS